MDDNLKTALAQAADLAAAGRSWEAMTVLTGSGIEAVILRLVADSMSDLPLSSRERAVGHAMKALFETWDSGSSVRNILAFLKKAAQRKASDLRRYRVSETAFDLEQHDAEAQAELWDEGYQVRREIALRLARELLPDLGLPSVEDALTAMLDLIEQGEPAKPAQVAITLGIDNDGTLRQQLKRGLDRLEERAAQRDLTELIDKIRDDIYREQL